MRRKLAAILAADVVGYSRLMGADEMGTLESLRLFRSELLGPSIAAQRGRIIKSMGDGWIVLFESAVDAVACSLLLQDKLLNHEVITLRVGVHIGDVIHDEEDVFGDAVNIAARLQEAAQPGGVAISDAAFGALDGTLTPSFDDTGLRDLKNIERPVRIWQRAQVSSASIVASKHSEAGDERSGFPELTLLPFVTSDDRVEVRELCDALTGDCTTYLGSCEFMNVLTKEAGKEGAFGLQAVLRSHQDRLRLEVKLSDPSGAEIWREKYNGDLSDPFEWQDEVGLDIASHVVGVIRDSERQRLAERPLEALSGRECSLFGLLDWNISDRDAVQRSLRYFHAAIEKEPDFTLSPSLALSFLLAVSNVGYTEVYKEFSALAPAWRERLAAHRSPGPEEEICLAIISYGDNGDERTLKQRINAILRRSPFGNLVLGWAGWGWLWLGEPQRALECFEKFDRLGRFSPLAEAVGSGRAIALIQSGRDEAAIAHIRQLQETMPNYVSLNRSKAAAYAHLGLMEEAGSAIAELLEASPGDSITQIRQRVHYADTPANERYFEGLRLAGLPA